MNGDTKKTLFADHTKFDDSTPKTDADTNMTADAQLGYPLEFDLYGFWFEIEHNSTIRTEIEDIYNKGVFKWFFGQNVN